MRDIEIVVRLTIEEDADIQEVVNEMDYQFDHRRSKAVKS